MEELPPLSKAIQISHSKGLFCANQGRASEKILGRWTNVGFLLERVLAGTAAALKVSVASGLTDPERLAFPVPLTGLR
jgi:hypothetical protein